MSSYDCLEGCIKYTSEHALETILEKLTRGGWMNKHNIWLDETGNKKYNRPNPTVNTGSNTLRIPRSYYRNLSRLETDFIQDAEIATIIGASMDGHFTGWVVTEQSNWEADLRMWARTQGHEIPPHDRPDETLIDWQNEIINEWHDAHANYPRFS